MENIEEMQLLIGQLSADALIRDALVISLMEVIPDLHTRLESKVAVAAPGAFLQLGQPYADAFQTRLTEFRSMLSNAAR